LRIEDCAGRIRAARRDIDTREPLNAKPITNEEITQGSIRNIAK
jgi:hypothetical protein